jgi:hypothetical protein
VVVQECQALVEIREYLLGECKAVKRVNKGRVLVGVVAGGKAANLMQKVVNLFFRRNGELAVERTQNHVFVAEASFGAAII